MMEKPNAIMDNENDNDLKQLNTRHIAERGTAATDIYGRPLYQIDEAAERRLRWKIDLMVVPTVSLLYLFAFIDRANVGNARLAGLEADLGLVGNDYNALLSYFYISYILVEIPASITCKIVGPGIFIPATTLGFGIVSLCTTFVTTEAQAAAVRFILGIFEAGMLPGIALYMSRWYRRSELAYRLALYIVMAPLAGAFGGLLASGILTLNSIGPYKSWRMIFLVEGIITIGLALISFVTVTDRPETARWLSKAEKDLAIARIKSERVGTTEVLDGIDFKKLMRGIFSPVTLSTAMIFLLNNVTVQGLAFFLPTIVATIYPTASTVRKQLLTVPPYAVGAVFVLALNYASWKTDKRTLFIIISTPFTMIGYIMFLATTDATTRYGATFLVAVGAFSYGALCNAQISANVVSDTARSSAIGLNVMFGNIGGLISTWSFLAYDAPNYRIGNGLNLATSSTLLVIAVVLLFWMTRDNKRREKTDVDAAIAGLSMKEIQDLDWKHPGFRWRP